MQSSLHSLKGNGFEITEDLYKDITLDPNEEAMALYEARKSKAGRLHAEAYKVKIQEERQYLKLDSIGMRAYALKNFKDTQKKNFKLDGESEIMLNILSAYFGRDQYFTSLSNDYSFDKGLALFGNIGVGKTALMRMFCENSLQSYGIITCKSIEKEYNDWNSKEFPENPVDSYGRKMKKRFYDSMKYNPFGNEFDGFCFDDLGTETIPAKNYGREMNVMSEIFLSRYNKKEVLPFNMTHFTTNLPIRNNESYPKEKYPVTLELLYGNRVTDRMREMFNVIQFSSASSRR